MSVASAPLLQQEAASKAEKVTIQWTFVLCIVYSVICALATLVGLLAADVGPRWAKPNEDELWHARVAILLIVSSVMTEMCFLFSSSSNVKFMGWNLTSSLQLHRMGDSLLTLGEYGAKLVCGLYIWWGAGGIVHTDTLAWGGARPVYLARFAQWSVAVPTLVLISNKAFFTKESTVKVALRSIPAVIACFLYCWASWVMEVTTSVVVRWIMFYLSMFGFVVVSLDQLALALAHRNDELFGWKIFMVVYQLVSFTGYSTVFCLGRFGVLSSLCEQCIYAYTDASVKVFQGAILAMIRNREDLCIIKRWWVAALMASQDLDNLVQRAGVPVFALDVEGRIKEWNQSLQKLTGWTIEQVHKKPLTEVVSADSRESVQLTINYVLDSAAKSKAGVKASDEVVASSSAVSNFVEISIPVASSGAGGARHSKQLAMTFVPKSTDAGKLAGIMAIGQDLSDVVELKILQERKNALMALLSHEIRSPLHGMMGLTGALLESEAGKAIHRQLGMVNGCAARLLDLVTNIMDLAQSEKRKKEGRPAPRPKALVNFSSIADEVQTMTEMAVDKMNKPLIRPSVRLINELAGVQVPLILGDPQKCVQLMYNLVTNACKFTDRGTVTINANYLQEAQRLEVEVIDTGKGISKEGQKRIFQAFEQEQNGDARSFQGIGLGLAVCTEIVELHGGELRVRSELGQGSTFTASLPCDGTNGLGPAFGGGPSLKKEPEPQAAPSPPAAAPAPAPCEEPKEPPLVLSVDDDEVNQEVIKSALNGMCELFCAMDGMQAIRFLEERKNAGLKLPDSVLLDIQMPGMSGFEVCEEIRKNFEAAHMGLPIIMVSAKAPPNKTAIQGYNTGTTDFVQKPFDPEVLRKKMGVILQAKRGFDLGGSTTLVAQHAVSKLKEAEEARDKAVAAAKGLEGKAEAAESEAKQLREKLAAAEKKTADVQQLNDQLKLQQVELRQQQRERQQPPSPTKADAALEQRAQAAEARAQEAEQRESGLAAQLQELREQLQKQQQAPEVKAQAEVRAAQAELREAELRAQVQELRAQLQRQQQAPQPKAQFEELREQMQRQHAQEAERRDAEMKAQIQELWEQMQKQQTSAVQAVVPPSGPELGPRALIPTLNFRDKDEPHMSCGSSLATMTARAASGRSTSVAGGDSKRSPRSKSLSHANEQHRRLVGVLLRQLVSARAVVAALSARMESLGTAARGCVQLLRSPVADLPVEIWGDDMKDEHLRAQLKGYQSMAHILSAHLTLMGHMAVPPESLTAGILHDDLSAELSESLGKGI